MPFLSWYKNIFSLKFSSCLFEEVLHFVYNNRDRFFFSFLFFIDFIELHIFLCSPPLLSPSFQPSSKVPMLLIYSGDHVFFYFPCRFDPCMSLLESSLLCRFSGIVIFRLVFFALSQKGTYEWVHMIFVFLALGYLTQGDIFQLMYLPVNFKMLFFSAV